MGKARSYLKTKKKEYRVYLWKTQTPFIVIIFQFFDWFGDPTFHKFRTEPRRISSKTERFNLARSVFKVLSNYAHPWS